MDTDSSHASDGINRPWTPGPWVPVGFPPREREQGMVRRTAAFDITQDQYRPFDVPSIDADNRLLALAPDMAEAILAVTACQRWSDAFCGEMSPELWDALDDIAMKLRMIGSTDAR